MKKVNLSLAFAMLFVLLGLSAQAQYTVTQDHRFKPTTNCFSPNIPTFSEQGQGVAFKVVTVTSHNIPSFNLANTLNNQCRRYMYFDIYDVSGGTPVFEGRITKSPKWLQGSVMANASNRFLTTEITIPELDGLNLSSGTKELHLSVEYDYFGNTPSSVQLNSWENSSFGCVYPDITTTNGVTCDMGHVFCFDYSECDADLDVDGTVYLEEVSPGNGSFWQKRYDFDVNVTGGSGNYSYQWSVNYFNGPTSSTSYFNFATTRKGVIIYLWVTDNVTGCTYLWNSNGKNNDLLLDASPLTMTVAPNPVAKGASLKVVYHLPEAGTVDFSIFDLSGKQVQALNRVESRMGENEVDLQSETFPQGIYFIKMHSNNNALLTRKLIVK